jgi:hypothetical protein
MEVLEQQFLPPSFPFSEKAHSLTQDFHFLQE